MPSSHSCFLIRITFSVLAVITAGKGTKREIILLAAGDNPLAFFNNKLKPTEIEIAAVTAPVYPCKNVEIFVGLIINELKILLISMDL